MTSKAGVTYVRSLVAYLGPDNATNERLGDVYAWARALDEASSTGEFWACHEELRAWIGEVLEDDSAVPALKPPLREYLSNLEIAAQRSNRPVEHPAEPTFAERVEGILGLNKSGVDQLVNVLAAAHAADATDDDDEEVRCLRVVLDLAQATLDSGGAPAMEEGLRELVSELSPIFSDFE